MNGFQIVAVAITGGFALLAIVGLLRRKISPPVALLWLILWTAATVTIIQPQLTVFVARRLGIERGADVVFYFAILAMFGGFFLVYAKLRRLEQSLTQIVRELAVREAVRPDESN